MIIPEVNPDHAGLINFSAAAWARNVVYRGQAQTARSKVTSPRCPLMAYGPETIIVATYRRYPRRQNLCGLAEMERNLIPYIGGEEEKSEQEPLKIWGTLSNSGIIKALKPKISAQCYRVAVQEGHTAALSVRFARPVSRQEILYSCAAFRGLPQQANLPSAPQPFLIYQPDDTRPQPALAAWPETAWRSRSAVARGPGLDWKFTCCAQHLRGAAGGAILTAELSSTRLSTAVESRDDVHKTCASIVPFESATETV